MSIPLVTTRGFASSTVTAAVVRRGYGVYDAGEGDGGGGGSSSGTLGTLAMFIPIFARLRGRRR